MINWNRLIRKTSHPRSLLAKIAAGYITVLLTVGCIIYIGIHEWREIRSIETNVRQINRQKRTIRNVYMKMLELSLFCDIFTEWDEKDFNTYLKQKSAVDSLLYGLQELHPNARIDSIRILWKDKEQSMLQIKEIMRKQQQAGREIAGQLPQTAGQSPPKKTGRKGGFLKRLFGKKRRRKPLRMHPHSMPSTGPLRTDSGNMRASSPSRHISSPPATGCSTSSFNRLSGTWTGTFRKRCSNGRRSWAGRANGHWP